MHRCEKKWDAKRKVKEGRKNTTFGNMDSSLAVVTKLGAGRLRNLGSIPSGSKAHIQDLYFLL
jgi:hypothetical protein